MSRGIERLLRALDGTGEILVFHCSHHDKVDFTLEQRAELVKESEIGIDALVAVHGSQLDQQVDITLAGDEIVVERRTESIEPGYLVASTGGGYCLAFSQQHYALNRPYRNRTHF